MGVRDLTQTKSKEVAVGKDIRSGMHRDGCDAGSALANGGYRYPGVDCDGLQFIYYRYDR